MTGPPPFDTLDTLPAPASNDAGTSTYSDVEFGTTVGFRPVRMDVMIPAATSAVPVVVFIHGGAFTRARTTCSQVWTSRPSSRRQPDSWTANSARSSPTSHWRRA